MKSGMYKLFVFLAICGYANVTAARPWDPLTDAGANLVGWYDASDVDGVVTNTSATSNVLSWQDKSGNDYHMNIGGNRPTYVLSAINGLNVLWFSDTSDELYINGIPDINCSNVCVISVGEPKTAGDYPNFGTIYSTDLSDKLSLRLNSNTTSGQLSNSLKLDGAATSLASGSSTNLAEETPLMLAVWYDGSNGVARTDGGDVSYTANAPDGATFTINEIQCGRDSNTPKNYHGEMVVLSTADIDTIEKCEGYLAWKWGIQHKLPNDHPYKNAAPDIPPAGTVITIR
jgi:hypothetical protein